VSCEPSPNEAHVERLPAVKRLRPPQLSLARIRFSPECKVVNRIVTIAKLVPIVVFTKFLARNNKNHTPITALITTNLAVQTLLVTVLFVHDALDFMLALDTALSLIP
jgi:hypothetical protein